VQIKRATKKATNEGETPMQIMYEAGCSATMYQAQGKAHDFPDLTNDLCPQCKADYLKKHGYYNRYLITLDFEGIIMIRRYYCRECKKTVSLLPSFCHPKRTYGILVIYKLLSAFYIELKKVCMAITAFITATGIQVTRQLLHHYRHRIERNLNNLVMAITDIYTLDAPPVTEKTEAKEKVRQFLSQILCPQGDSLKIFKRTRTTYLTHQTL
jgi:hypothetical protein